MSGTPSLGNVSVVSVVERTTGECKKTHLFCGVLPFSACVFRRIRSAVRRTSDH